MPISYVIDLNPKVSSISEQDCSNTQVSSINDFDSSFVEIDFDACIQDTNQIVTNIENSDCYMSVPMSILPFRVGFTTISTGGYSPTNPAPIGIAILGSTNYIL
jgi:hypothetical protein